MMKKNKYCFWLILFAITNAVSPQIALGQTSDPMSENLGAALARTGAALLFILALFFLFVYLVKRYYPSALGAVKTKVDSKDKIEVIAFKNIGPKRHLYLVKVHEKEILIGVTDNNINTLAKWNDLVPEKDNHNDNKEIVSMD
jgi:flagellar biosynthetic protein FliO